MKFTFKTEKPTGRYRSFYPDMHTIKFNKIDVGEISDNTWQIHLRVMKTDEDVLKEGNNPNCNWKTIHFKVENNSLQAAKDWLNNNIEKITSQWTLVSE